jgi:hypothetical protein
MSHTEVQYALRIRRRRSVIVPLRTWWQRMAPHQAAVGFLAVGSLFVVVAATAAFTVL